MKSKLDKSDIGKLIAIPDDLSKLSDVVKINVVKKTEYDKLIKKVNTIDTSGFVRKIDYGSKVNEIKGKIPSIAGLATTAALNDAKKRYMTLVM